jgi:hypothetical protein
MKKVFLNCSNINLQLYYLKVEDAMYVFTNNEEVFLAKAEVYDINKQGLIPFPEGIGGDDLDLKKVIAAAAAINLAGWKMVKRINYDVSSYTIKHYIERTPAFNEFLKSMGDNSGYLSNGELIAAMKLNGFNVESLNNGINGYFNVGSLKFLKPKIK